MDNLKKQRYRSSRASHVLHNCAVQFLSSIRLKQSGADDSLLATRSCFTHHCLRHFFCWVFSSVVLGYDSFDLLLFQLSVFIHPFTMNFNFDSVDSIVHFLQEIPVFTPQSDSSTKSTSASSQSANDEPNVGKVQRKKNSKPSTPASAPSQPQIQGDIQILPKGRVR